MGDKFKFLATSSAVNCIKSVANMGFCEVEMQLFATDMDVHMVKTVFSNRNMTKQHNELKNFDGKEILVCFACANEKLDENWIYNVTKKSNQYKDMKISLCRANMSRHVAKWHKSAMNFTELKYHTNKIRRRRSAQCINFHEIYANISHLVDQKVWMDAKSRLFLDTTFNSEDFSAAFDSVTKKFCCSNQDRSEHPDIDFLTPPTSRSCDIPGRFSLLRHARANERMSVTYYPATKHTRIMTEEELEDISDEVTYNDNNVAVINK